MLWIAPSPMRFLFLLLLGIVPPVCRAVDIQVLLQRQATACAKSLLSGDYETFAAYTHPRIIAAMGGKRAMIDRLKSATDDMKAQGYVFDTTTIGNASPPFPVQNWLLSYVPMQIVIQARGGHLKRPGILLGISEDLGLHWTFVDLTGNTTADAFFKIYPELVGKMQFPPRSETEFVPDS